MLLKDCYSIEPPTERLDTFWSELSERMEESPAAEPTPGGGGAVVGKEAEILFESTAAMQILNIPEPPPEPVAGVAEAAESNGAVAPAPAASPWRWPVALIFSTAIVVVGILAYKKMNPPQQPTYMASAAGGQERGSPHPGDPGQPGQPGMPPGATAAPGEPPADESAASGETKADTETAPGEEANAAPGDEAKAAPGAETKAAPAKDGEGKPRARTKARGKRRARKGGAKAPAKPAAQPAPATAARRAPTRPKKKKASGSGDELDSLIDGVIGKQAAARKKKSVRAAALPLAPGLPEKLGEGQIRGAMKKIMGRVQACYDKYQVEGNARVKLTITPTGKPSKVSIKGKFFGTDTGNCVVKAVKKARFPKFSGKPMTIRYPFLLQ